MHLKPARRSSLFLLELIVAILFFCLCTAFCVRLFVRSHTLTAESENLTMAVRHSANFAELFQNTPDPVSRFSAECPEGIWQNESSFLVYYSEDWQSVSEENAVFLLTAAFEEKDGLTGCTLTVTDMESKEAVYTLHTEKYTEGGAVS